MYHPIVIAARMSKMADRIRESDPSFTWRDYAPGDLDEWKVRLDLAYDPDEGRMLRPLTADEEAFIQHEMAHSKIDAPYWLTHYAYIKTKAQTLQRIKFFQSQEILMRRIGEEELATIRGEHWNGILLAILKARQVGASTIAEGLISHRTFFYANTTGLVAADRDEQSAYLFDMMERICDNLPWWMKPRSADPKRDYRVKDKQMYFADQDSLILVESSKSIRGGESGRAKGSMGTGKTYPLVHLSELAIWENPEQIDDALMPAIPKHPRTLALFESTAKGRGNWWHDTWVAVKKGESILKPVFIPWYVMGRDIASEDITYSQPAPESWRPSDIAVAHARRCAETSAKWCGERIELSRNQLYWWEKTRADYMGRKKLHNFLAEYAADDMEAFQNTTASIFRNELIHEMRQNARDKAVIVEIHPRTDLRPAA